MSRVSRGPWRLGSKARIGANLQLGTLDDRWLGVVVLCSLVIAVAYQELK